MGRSKLISVIFVFGILLLSAALVSSDVDHQSEIEEGRQLVESKISCDNLDNEQLEAIGEYLMEQMHPGEAHEIIHERMGLEEGTEAHEQFHVNIAKMMYCSGSGMMGSGGVMGMMGGQTQQRNMMQRMLGSYYSSYGVFGWILMILVIITLVLLIIWLIKQIQGSGRDKRRKLK